MAPPPAAFFVTELQWLKMHLRLVAAEDGGQRLYYRFEFPAEADVTFICHIYFEDDDLNSMKLISQEDRIEIYEGRVDLGLGIIRRGLELAELPGSFVWNPTIEFVLYEAYGMGGSIVHRMSKSFVWPEVPDK
jgi:hypothetical protein